MAILTYRKNFKRKNGAKRNLSSKTVINTYRNDNGGKSISVNKYRKTSNVSNGSENK